MTDVWWDLAISSFIFISILVNLNDSTISPCHAATGHKKLNTIIFQNINIISLFKKYLTIYHFFKTRECKTGVYKHFCVVFLKKFHFKQVFCLYFKHFYHLFHYLFTIVIFHPTWRDPDKRKKKGKPTPPTIRNKTGSQWEKKKLDRSWKNKKLKEIERRAVRVNNGSCVSAIVDCVSATGVKNCGYVSAIVDCISAVGSGKWFLHGTRVSSTWVTHYTELDFHVIKFCVVFLCYSIFLNSSFKKVI